MDGRMPPAVEQGCCGTTRKPSHLTVSTRWVIWKASCGGRHGQGACLSAELEGGRGSSHTVQPSSPAASPKCRRQPQQSKLTATASLCCPSCDAHHNAARSQTNKDDNSSSPPPHRRGAQPMTHIPVLHTEDGNPASPPLHLHGARQCPHTARGGSGTAAPGWPAPAGREERDVPGAYKPMSNDSSARTARTCGEGGMRCARGLTAVEQ